MTFTNSFIRSFEQGDQLDAEAFAASRDELLQRTAAHAPFVATQIWLTKATFAKLKEAQEHKRAAMYLQLC